jgi:hypothetical protein
MNRQRVSLVDGVVVEKVGTELVVFLPESSDIVRLSGRPAELLLQLVEGVAPDPTDSALVAQLTELGILRSSAISRRRFVKAGALGVGAGLSLMALPHSAAAASSGAAGSSGDLSPTDPTPDPTPDPPPTPQSTGLPGDPVPAVTPEDALVLYVDAMNPESYAGTGATWFDLGPNENDVFFPVGKPLQHPTHFTDDGVGGSGLSWFVFDGNDYFDITEEASKKIANIAPYTGSTGYTVEAWVWDDTGSSGSRNIVSSANRFLFLAGTSLQTGGPPFDDLVSPSFPKGQWVYVAFTYDTASTRATLYVDADQKAQKNSAVNYVVNERLTVGAHNLTTPTSFWRGRMTEVRIFARELSGAEITSNYNATKGRYYPPAP